MQIKKLILDNFKGAVHKEFAFGKTTSISGQNALGKTTIMSGFYWLLADKDADLTSNPNIRPIGVAECTPTVTAVLDIDGKEVAIAKMQKCKISKPDDNGVSKVALSNTYEVNAVPKSERDFKAYLENLGLSFDTFLACSHPSVFTSQKQADMRKILFGMASSKSDYDIAVMDDATKDVADMLRDYTVEEITAMQNASKKKSQEQVEAIPNQIIGLEKAKVETDVAELELQKSELERKIADVTAKITDKSTVLGNLESKKFALKFEINGVYTKVNDTLISERRKLQTEISELEEKKRKKTLDIKEAKDTISESETTIERAENIRKELIDQWKAENESVFGDTICPRCGQKFPDKMLADGEKKFNENKAVSLKNIEDRGNKWKSTIVENKRLIDEKKQALSDLVNDLEKTDVSILLVTTRLAEMPDKPDMETNAEYQALLKRDADLDKQIAELPTVDNSALEDDLKQMRADLDFVNCQIAEFNNNIRIDNQILELQENMLNYQQAIADAERILDQLDKVSKKKNLMLTDEINSHFNLVTWKLFDYLKNSEYKECCIPQYEEKDFGVSTNSALKIIMQLDIIKGLQKYYGQSLPVFVDGAECLDSISKSYIEMDCQIIYLCVSEDKELVVTDKFSTTNVFEIISKKSEEK